MIHNRAPASPPVFVDVAAESGLRHVHVDGSVGEYHMVETLGPGGALLDLEGDGDLDVYLVQGGELDATPDTRSVGDRVFRNAAADTGALAFDDVTDELGLRARGYGIGAAVGDLDGDGDPDLHVLNWGANQTLRNDGGRRLVDVSAASGTADPAFSSAAVFVDTDLDGDLDLFVANYVDFSLANHKPCWSGTGERDFCGPFSFGAQPDRLYRNDGAGRFEDVSGVSGLAAAYGAALGVVALDADRDGRPDLYVANDAMPNQLWRNRPDGRFEDLALVAGCAVNGQGEAEASMGIALGDADDDGDEDLFVTHLRGETHTLWRCDGPLLFTDATLTAGLSAPSRARTGFGTGFLDWDRDGRLDLFAVHGTVQVLPELRRAGDPHPLHQPDLLLRNTGGLRFEDVSAAAGDAFGVSRVTRGALVGDLDGDGDRDLVLLDNRAPVRLLRNDTAGGPWLGLTPVLRDGGAPAHLARVVARLDDGRALHRTVRREGGYASAHDPRVRLFVEPERITSLEVHWLDGARERFDTGALRVGRDQRLVRGRGRPVGAPAAGAATASSTSPSSDAAQASSGWRAVDLSVPLPLRAPGELTGMDAELAERIGAAWGAVQQPTASMSALARAEALGRLAMLAHAHGLPDVAAPAYERAAQLQRADPRWAWGAAQALEALGRTDRARAQLEALLATTPTHVPASLARARQDAERGHLDEAEGQLRALLGRRGADRPGAGEVAADARDAGLAAAAAALGRLLLETQRHAEAVPWLELALAHAPEATRLHESLALAHRALGDDARAQQHLAARGAGRVVAPDALRDELDALTTGVQHELERGDALALEGRLAEARAAFEGVLARDPDNLAALMNLGTVLSDLGLHEAARASYERAAALQPEHPRVQFGLGRLAAGEGDDVRAVDHYERALAADAGDLDARFNLANSLRRLGRRAEAARAFDEVVRRAPERHDARFGRALCRMRTGQWRAARDDLERDVASAPGDPRLLAALGRLLAACPDDSLRDGPRALRISEALVDARRSLEHVELQAMALAEVGRLEEAVSLQQQAVQAATDAGAQQRLATLRANLTRYAAGQACRDPWPAADG